jgi:hypothetical protein
MTNPHYTMEDTQAALADDGSLSLQYSQSVMAGSRLPDSISPIYPYLADPNQLQRQ